jgi:transposase
MPATSQVDWLISMTAMSLLSCSRATSDPLRDDMGRAARERHHRRRKQPTRCPMPQPNDMNRSLAALDENDTLIAVIEMSQSSWLVVGIVPGVERHPAKKLEPSEAGLLRRLHAGARRLGRPAAPSTGSRSPSRRGATASGWPVGCGRTASKPGPAPAKAGVIHPNSIVVSREHRRAKTDRLDTGC